MVDSEVADDVLEPAKKRALEKLEDIARRLADDNPAIITSLSIGVPLAIDEALWALSGNESEAMRKGATLHS